MNNRLRPSFWLLSFSVLLIVVSVVCRAPIFSQDLSGVHVWRQSQTQLHIVNFYRHDFNILNPRHNMLNLNEGNTILRYEFPLMQWLIAANHRLLGESIQITRISLFLFSLITLLGVFKLCYVSFQHRWSAFAATWAFAFSPLFYYYAINPLPDNFALLATVWFLTYFFSYLKSNKTKDLLLSALFISVAILSKLPFIVFGAVVAFYVLTHLFKQNFRQALPTIVAFSLALVPPAIWYGTAIPTWGGNGVLKGVMDNPITWQEIIAILNYHASYTLPKILLNWGSLVFLIVGVVFVFIYRLWRKWLFWAWATLAIATLAYFFFEINMINKVHDYYLMPFLPLLYILVAYGIHQILKRGKTGVVAVVIISLSMPFFAIQSVQHYWSIEMSGFNNDFFIYREALRKAAPQEALCIMLNDHSNYILSYQIDKKGFIFANDIPSAWVKDMILRFDATYLYSDNRALDENPETALYFDRLIGQYGTVKVFKLKAKEAVF